MAQQEAPSARPRLLQAAVDAFGQPDVRQKILFTLAMLLVFRFVAHVPVPGVNSDRLQDVFDNNAILGFLNIFSAARWRISPSPRSASTPTSPPRS